MFNLVNKIKITNNMTKYKLYYFPSRGRAEMIRILFAYADIDYEDIRIPMEEWPKHKPSMPMEQMPCLEIDGDKCGQSGAVLRYLAREHGFSGKDSKEEYYIDMISACLDDVGKKFPSEKDETKKAALMKEYVGVYIPDMMNKIEKVVSKFPSDSKFVFGKLSIADLSIFSLGDFFYAMNPNLFDATPRIKAIYDNVKAVPKIAAWIEKRPKTEF